MSDPFWTTIDKQIAELATAKTAQDVLSILSPARDPYGPDHKTGGEGFFAGSGGDATVFDALIEAGWRRVWWEASYYYAMAAPDGSIITYIEGDVFARNTRA